MLIDATPHDRACLIESVSGTWYYRNISEAANRSDIFYNPVYIDRGAVNTEYDIGFKYSSGTKSGQKWKHPQNWEKVIFQHFREWQ